MGDGARGRYLTTWDYSLAFDHAHPLVVGEAFDRLGMPGRINNMLSQQWLHQRRWLQLGRGVHPVAQDVNSSLP